eukprot:COSAG02_NODE_26092_length_641_cov_0.957565_2_plen_26_part_01
MLRFDPKMDPVTRVTAIFDCDGRRAW